METSLHYWLLLVFLSIFHKTCYSGTMFWQIKHAVEKHRTDRIKTKYQEEFLKTPKDDYPTHYIRQQLDNFNPEIRTTYNQRYWVNRDHWKAPDGPVFLSIGGEVGLSEASVIYGLHVDLAKKYGALLFAVEHRFYGASMNEDGLELDQLQYLSSQQA